MPGHTTYKAKWYFMHTYKYKKDVMVNIKNLFLKASIALFSQMEASH